LTYYQRLLARAREAIEQGRFGELLARHRILWAKNEEAHWAAKD